jgi:hypothetical protein
LPKEQDLQPAESESKRQRLPSFTKGKILEAESEELRGQAQKTKRQNKKNTASLQQPAVYLLPFAQAEDRAFISFPLCFQILL